MTMPASMLDVALSYQAAGRSVVPIAPGSKKPSFFNEVTGEFQDLAWKTLQQSPLDQGRIRVLFAPTLLGIGIVCGPVSGVVLDGVRYALEVLDIDDTEELLEQFIEAANWQGLGEVLQRMVHQRTPGGAGHFAYLCSAWEGNIVLARRPRHEDEPEQPPCVTLIETRGEGGQAVVAPTPPGIHPDHPDRGYELVHGSWTDLPIITPEERHALLELARSFNTYVDTKQVRNPKGPLVAGANGTRPGDVLNAAADQEWWQALLEAHSWTLVHQRGDIEYWRRPGKEESAWSATLGACGVYFYVFSSNAAPFEQSRAYSPFSAYALLEHSGDFTAAAKALAPPRKRRPGAPPLTAEDDTADLLTRVEDEEDIDGLAQLARQEDDASHDLTRRYRATRGGLMWAKPTKDGPTDVLLTNFCAHIVSQITEDDGAETRLHFDLSATRGAVTHTFRIPAQQFAGMGWVAEQLGAEAIVLPGMTIKDHARAAIQILSPTIERRHVYTHIGWRQLSTGWIYLHAGGAVSAGGLLADVTVEPEGALARYLLCVPGMPTDGQAALLASMRVLTVAPPHIVVPLYGAIWRSLLGTCDLSVHLTGETGKGKSELAALDQQHWGAAMDARHLPASWTSTANALEVLAFQAKDAILVIDDFCPRGSPAEVSQLHGKADRVLRAQGNRSARQRLDRMSKSRPAKPPRGLIVSTGEDIPQGQSLRARICILEVTPETVDWKRLTSCQADAAKGLYAQAMAAFVQWLAPQYDAVLETMPEDLITLRAAAVQTTHRRTPELIANLALGWRYFLACAQDLGVLSAAECEQFWGWAWRTLGEVGSAQQAHQADDDPVQRFLALLRGAITAGLAHVQDARTYEHPPQAQDWGWSVRDITSPRPEDASQVWTPHGSCIGYLDDTRLYLEPEASYSVVQRMAETQRAPLALTQRTLHKRMAERGLLIRQPSQTHHTVSKRLGPSQNLKRVLDIAVSSLVPLYSATSGNFGNNGNEEAQSQENKGLAVLPVPPWRGKLVVTSESKVVTDENAAPASVTTNFGDVTTNFGDLLPQLIENKRMLLKLPQLPVVADIYPHREEKSSRDTSTLTDEVTL